MARCINCIHDKVCNDRAVESGIPFVNADTCEHFKSAADVVEVVRCENCKHWDKENIKKYTYSSDDSTLVDFAECLYWSNWATCHSTRYNDYCSLAEERKKEYTEGYNDG